MSNFNKKITQNAIHLMGEWKHQLDSLVNLKHGPRPKSKWAWRVRTNPAHQAQISCRRLYFNCGVASADPPSSRNEFLHLCKRISDFNHPDSSEFVFRLQFQLNWFFFFSHQLAVRKILALYLLSFFSPGK